MLVAEIVDIYGIFKLILLTTFAFLIGVDIPLFPVIYIAKIQISTKLFRPLMIKAVR